MDGSCSCNKSACTCIQLLPQFQTHYPSLRPLPHVSISFSLSLFFSFLVQVSWVRQADLHILTSGNYTYTSDQRFRAIHIAATNDWTLEVREAQLSDSGVYECQISTETKLSLSVYLRVIGTFRLCAVYAVCALPRAVPHFID